MRLRPAFASLLLVAASCGGSSRRTRNTVPVEPEMPELPEMVEMCVGKAVVLPGKMDGKAWDGIGGALRRKDRKLIPQLAGAAATGGYSAAVTAAGAVGAGIFKAVKGPPDLRVRVQLGKKFIIKTSTVKDTPIAAFGASEQNCGLVVKKYYGSRIQFFVEDMDLNKPDAAGSKSFVGIPREAFEDGVWQVTGFDLVIEIEVTLQEVTDAKSSPPVEDDPEPAPDPVPENRPAARPTDEPAPEPVLKPI